MKLHPQGSAGHWQNPDWEPGTPGTFAVVIGVSVYHHLLGGDRERAGISYELGQLEVSALAAQRFFDWLSAEHRIKGAPIAHAWLLTNPTRAELVANPRLGEHHLPATFDACRDSIRAWHATMKPDLTPTSAPESHAIFFFCGHGLEKGYQNQILLLGDYLRPPGEVRNEALSSMNLWEGLGSLHVPNQFFFLDACRKFQRGLRKVRLKGTDVLDVEEGEGRVVRCPPVLRASVSGEGAYQQRYDSAGTSVFTDTLLGGLRARHGFEADCEPTECLVRIKPLSTYVHEIVRRFTARHGLLQSVPLGGETYGDPVVTTLPGRSPSLPPGSGPDPGDPAYGPDDDGLSLSPFGLPISEMPDVWDLPPIEEGTQFLAIRPVDPKNVFGSEWMSRSWDATRMLDRRRMTWNSSAKFMRLSRVARSRDGNLVRVVFNLHPNLGPGIFVFPEQIVQGDWRRDCAAFIPGNLLGPADYVLEVVKERESPRGIASFEVGGRARPGTVLAKLLRARAARQRGQRSQALAILDTAMRELLGPTSQEHPFLTVLAATIMSELRPDYDFSIFSPYSSWLREIPDWTVLVNASRLAEDSSSEGWVKVAEQLTRVRDQGLPWLPYGRHLLERQVRRILRLEEVPEGLREEIEGIAELLERAEPHTIWSGFFLTMRLSEADAMDEGILGEFMGRSAAIPT